MEFNYSAMRAAVFIMNADVSNWTRTEWDYFYPEIASYEQLVLYNQLTCICGNCSSQMNNEFN